MACYCGKRYKQIPLGMYDKLSDTGFTQKELQEMHDRFNKLSNRRGYLNRIQFREIMGVLGMENVGQSYSDRIFNILKSQNTLKTDEEIVKFEEFAQYAGVVTNGDQRNKSKLAFQLISGQKDRAYFTFEEYQTSQLEVIKVYESLTGTFIDQQIVENMIQEMFLDILGQKEVKENLKNIKITLKQYQQAIENPKKNVTLNFIDIMNKDFISEMLQDEQKKEKLELYDQFIQFTIELQQDLVGTTNKIFQQSLQSPQNQHVTDSSKYINSPSHSYQPQNQPQVIQEELENILQNPILSHRNHSQKENNPQSLNKLDQIEQNKTEYLHEEEESKDESSKKNTPCTPIFQHQNQTQSNDKNSNSSIHNSSTTKINGNRPKSLSLTRDKTITNGKHFEIISNTDPFNIRGVMLKPQTNIGDVSVKYDEDDTTIDVQKMDKVVETQFGQQNTYPDHENQINIYQNDCYQSLPNHSQQHNNFNNKELQQIQLQMSPHVQEPKQIKSSDYPNGNGKGKLQINVNNIYDGLLQTPIKIESDVTHNQQIPMSNSSNNFQHKKTMPCQSSNKRNINSHNSAISPLYSKKNKMLTNSVQINRYQNFQNNLEQSLNLNVTKFKHMQQNTRQNGLNNKQQSISPIHRQEDLFIDVDKINKEIYSGDKKKTQDKLFQLTNQILKINDKLVKQQEFFEKERINLAKKDQENPNFKISNINIHGKVEDEHNRKGVMFINSNWNVVLSIMIGIHRAVTDAQKNTMFYLRNDEDREFKIKNHFELLPIRRSVDKISYKISKFVDYAPYIFLKIRQLYCIQSEEYLKSIGPEQMIGNLLTGDMKCLSEVTSTGKSGSFFYYSPDGKYTVKTISRSEFQNLRQILKEYYYYLQKNKQTFIIKFYGMHKLRFKISKYSKEKNIYFVVMPNVFQTKNKIDLRYDLKGSLYKRTTTSTDTSVARKDNNFLQDEKKIKVDNSEFKEFMEQIRKDSAFFAKNNIIDYSILLGIHTQTIDQQIKNSDVDEEKNQVEMGLIRKLVDNDIDSNGKQKVYYFGIIDVLTSFNVKKKMEFAFKRVFYGKDISAIPPHDYKDRFDKFIESIFDEQVIKNTLQQQKILNQSPIGNSMKSSQKYDKRVDTYNINASNKLTSSKQKQSIGLGLPGQQQLSIKQESEHDLYGSALQNKYNNYHSNNVIHNNGFSNTQINYQSHTYQTYNNNNNSTSNINGNTNNNGVNKQKQLVQEQKNINGIQNNNNKQQENYQNQQYNQFSQDKTIIKKVSSQNQLNSQLETFNQQNVNTNNNNNNNHQNNINNI